VGEPPSPTDADPDRRRGRTARARAAAGTVAGTALSADLVICAALAAGLTLLAFVTTGAGLDQSITVSAGDTWAEIVLVLLGAGAGAALVLLGARGRPWGAVTVALFVALTGFTALSILWSVQPDNSWQATNLTVAYLATFAAAAALARLAPERWRALLGAILITTVVLSAYGLATKVFPSASNTFGRLQNPLGYWNATGLAAALGLGPCLWAWSSRDLSANVRGLMVPAVAILIAVVVLSYSRSALLAALVAVACWLAIVPKRLHGVLLLASGSVGAAVIAGWALSKPALTSDNIAYALQRSAGHTYGFVLLVCVALLAAGGIAIARVAERRTLPDRVRRRIGTVLLSGVALLPVLGVLALAESSRGLTGEISHAWSSLTSSNSTTGNSASRVFALGSSRPLYWHEGLKVGEHALLKGVGALAFAVARTRYTTNPDVVVHAHSYVIQTFADLGLVGIAVAAGQPWSAFEAPVVTERQGLVGMLVVVMAFGLQSAIDWTWYFPGVAVPALLCAGWLAGRGPLTSPIGLARARGSIFARPAAGAAVAGVAAISLLLGWLIWQPLGSADAVSSAYAAAGAGHLTAAFDDARAAAAYDPLALQPKFLLSALYAAAGDLPEARAELVSAVRLQPDNPASWLALGSFDLAHRQPRLAVASLRRAQELDPTDAATAQALSQAEAAAAHG
jgi:O-Antigen ligase